MGTEIRGASRKIEGADGASRPENNRDPRMDTVITRSNPVVVYKIQLYDLIWPVLLALPHMVETSFTFCISLCILLLFLGQSASNIIFAPVRVNNAFGNYPCRSTK